MIGSRLGKWIIDKELGRGGMGRVYLAHEEAEGGLAAVKVLPAELAQEMGFLQRFQREISALQQLNHPNIVRFFESGVQDTTYFYVMEFIEGVTYEDILNNRTRLPWREVVEAALQVLPALKHAHDRGIIHRDLKPPNLMRTNDGVVKLTDFGIAKVFAGNHLTATGGVVGTAEYLSPEQAAGKPVTKRSDLYSFGIMLYAMLAGHPPFSGETILDLLHKHRYAQFERLRKLLPELPYELDDVITQMLAKEPAERQGDALVVQRQLETINVKLNRKAQHTNVDPLSVATRAENADAEYVEERGAGPATLMSRMMRQELEEIKRGSAFSQWINRPVVLLPAFLVCVGLIAWGFWLRSPPERDEAVEGSLETSLGADRAALRLAIAGIKSSQGMSEAERFYRRGLQLCRLGDGEGARQVWRGVITSFQAIDVEKRWVQLAEEGLTELDKRTPREARDLTSLDEAVKRCRQLLAEGKAKEARQLREALETLYRDDPAAAPALRSLAR